MPEAVAILDPKRDDCEYPYKELCGCGVGFKLIQALASKDNQSAEDLSEYLDLVATAIGADIGLFWFAGYKQQSKTRHKSVDFRSKEK